MKDLTSSVYTFDKLISGNFLYIDKTEYLWKLIKPATGQYFMSRPRRFGKSLTVSTLEAVFQGQKELFKGLAIYDKPYDWKKYPVIHLDFATSTASTSEQLTTFLLKKLETAAQELNVSIALNQPPAAAFEELVNKAAQKEQIIILIDEYDKPILSNVTNPEIADILKVLKGFFSVVKGTEAQQRFVFMTGVSKFSHVSVFSDLNNLTDITMEATFAAMLGYTQKELEHYFADRIDVLVAKKQFSREELLKKVKEHYNGYRFHPEALTVYNPVSLAQFFRNNGEFNNYWFKTGTPTFLLEMMKRSNFNYAETLTEPVSEAFFDSFEITNLKPKTLLYQTGYLTIGKRVQKQVPYTEHTITEYYLKFPNREVERSFNEQLLEYYTAVQCDDAQQLIWKLINAIGSGDVDGFMTRLKVMFANIPYNIHVANEHYYQTIFFVICDMLRFMVQAEICTNSGRIDMMVAAGEWIYVMEFKLNKSAGEALKQIQNKEYAMKYQCNGKKIMLIGINFDSEAGQITDWLKEEMQ